MTEMMLGTYRLGRNCRATKLLSLLTAVNMTLWQASSAFALPAGENVVRGEAEFAREDGVLTIQQDTDRAIVNYDSFNIGNGETVQFVQPRSSSAILNRVTKGGPSDISGILLANGGIYLINPNGVLISASARIDVGEFVASAMNLSDENFMAGRLKFEGGRGSVFNEGSINAARVVLVGKNAENLGTIAASEVTMATGMRSVEIDYAAGGIIRLIIDGEEMGPGMEPEADAPPAAVEPETPGSADAQPPADDPELPDTAEADETDQPNPTPEPSSVTYLTVINRGTMDTSGANGGQVAMQGHRVGQFGTVSADGIEGHGGSITIFGSKTVALGENSLTTANAGTAGNGGTIIIFSPDTALFRSSASIEARGGEQAGDGGMVEVSGRKHVEIFGSVDSSAPAGQAGLFLIDPSNVTIQNAADTPGSWPVTSQFNPASDSAICDVATLEANLQLNSVTITTANVGGTEAGNITVADAIDLDGTGGHMLWLQAANDIYVNAPIWDSDPSSGNATMLVLSGMRHVVVNSPITTGGGTLSLLSDSAYSGTGDTLINNNIDTEGGGFVSIGADLVVLAGSSIATDGGDTTLIYSGTVQMQAASALNTGGGSLDITTTDISLLGTISAGAVTVSDPLGNGVGLGSTAVGGGMNIDPTELQSISATTFQLNTADSMNVDNISPANSINANAVTLSADGTITFLNNASAFASLSVLADDGIVVDADVSTATGNLAMDGDADNAFDGLDDIAFADGVQLTAAGALSLDATTGDMNGAGALGLNANSGVTINDSLTTAGQLDINSDTDAATGGNLTVAAGVTVSGGANAVNVTANDVALSGTLAGGALTITDSDGSGAGLGSTPVSRGVNISQSELQNISATTFQLDTPGPMMVDNIGAADSENVNAVILSSDGTITFLNNPSTFDSLSVLADNGVAVNTDVSTDTGNLAMDGDANNTADGLDSIAFADGVQVSSAGALSLDATTGDMNGAGTLVLNANSGATINDNLTTAGNLTFNADATIANGVTVRSLQDLTVSDGFTLRGPGDLHVYADNDLTAGGAVSAGGHLDLRADYDGSRAGMLWIKGNASTDGTVPFGILTLVGNIAVDGTMTVGGSDMSLYGADRDDIDYSIEAPIYAGGVIIRMGHDILDATDGEDTLLNASFADLSARTGSIGSSGNGDIDTSLALVTARAGQNIYLEEADNVRITGGIAAGRAADLRVHGTLSGNTVSAGTTLRISANRDVTVNNLSSGGAMDLDGQSLAFQTLTAASVDADMSGSIAIGRATVSDLVDFTAAGNMTDNDSMIVANNVILEAGGNIGGSAIELDVARISRIVAGGNVHIRQNRSGLTPLGLVSAGGNFNVEVPNGGLSDGNDNDLNFVAHSDSRLQLHDTCGNGCYERLEIDIDGGRLFVNGLDLERGDHPSDWIWINLAGSIDGGAEGDAPIVYDGIGPVPGIILFNDQVFFDGYTGTEFLNDEGFMVETPELKSRPGVFGSPYFLHTYMQINEPIALGVVDYILFGQAEVNADPELPSTAKRTISMWPEGYVW